MINSRNKKILIFGLGNLGLPLAILSANAGYKVEGIDTDEEKIQKIRNMDINWLNEKKLEQIFKKNKKNINVHSNLNSITQKPNIIIICIPLLLRGNKPDLKVFNNVIKDLVKIKDNLKINKCLVILQTTVPVGFSKNFEINLQNKAGKVYSLVFSPERIKSGKYIISYLKNNKVISGSNSKSIKNASMYFNNINLSLNSKSKIKIVENFETAEFIKISENIYRDVNIALANELAWNAFKKNINFKQVRKICNELEECQIHEQGASVGGHCIPVYPYFFENFEKSKLVKTARSYNEKQPQKIINEVSKISQFKKNLAVLIVGIGFRDGVNSSKYSGAHKLIKNFVNLGHNVYILDSQISSKELKELGYNIYSNQKIDVVVTHTRNKKYLKLTFREIGKPKFVFDIANTLEKNSFPKSEFLRY